MSHKIGSKHKLSHGVLDDLNLAYVNMSIAYVEATNITIS